MNENMVIITCTEPGAVRDLQRSFSPSLSRMSATAAPERGLSCLFFQASTGPSQLRTHYSSDHSSLLNTLISHLMESRTGFYSMKTNLICTLYVCMNYWLEGAVAKLRELWIKQKFPYIAGGKGHGQNRELNECMRNLEQGYHTEMLQEKMAINLHDGDDLDKINIISFPDFQSSVLYQLYRCKLLKMQTHFSQLSQLSRPE